MSLHLTDLEKKVIPECKFIWGQKCLNKSADLIEFCGDDEEKIEEFFNECERKIKTLDKECRIIPNVEIQKFDGEEFSYAWFIFSDTLKITVKLAIKVDALEQSIGIGNMDLANKKEGKKLEKHLNSQSTTVSKEDEVAEK
jgi:hypothetical protein